MGPPDRPLRGHRATSLIFLGIRPNPKLLRDFLVHQFNRIDVLGPCERILGRAFLGVFFSGAETDFDPFPKPRATH